MKVAVTYENGEVFGHFGHSKQIKVYVVENNKVVSNEVIDLEGSGHGAIAGVLANNKVDVLICGGIGQGAKDALASNNIKLYGGVTGNSDEAVEKLISGTLEYNENVKCSHHEHHEEGHSCGSHSCKEDKNGCGGNH